MGGVYPVAVLFERPSRRLQRLRRPAQVTRDKCDLGLSDEAPRAGHRLFSTEGTPSVSQERLCSNEIAELRHRDASKSEGRRVVAQGDSLQRAKGITYRQRPRRGSDQRVHRNPVIFVTLTVRCLVLRLFHDQSPRDSGYATMNAATRIGGEPRDKSSRNRSIVPGIRTLLKSSIRDIIRMTTSTTTQII